MSGIAQETSVGAEGHGVTSTKEEIGVETVQSLFHEVENVTLALQTFAMGGHDALIKKFETMGLLHAHRTERDRQDGYKTGKTLLFRSKTTGHITHNALAEVIETKCLLTCMVDKEGGNGSRGL